MVRNRRLTRNINPKKQCADIYIDNKLVGLTIDHEDIPALFLFSKSTQTTDEKVPTNESYKEKYYKILKRYNILKKKHRYSINKINQLTKKHRKKTTKYQEIKKFATILGLDFQSLLKCKKKTPTKTCRQIIRQLFPDSATRAMHSKAKLGPSKVLAIQGMDKKVVS